MHVTANLNALTVIKQVQYEEDSSSDHDSTHSLVFFRLIMI
jgi:hypothetical protein